MFKLLLVLSTLLAAFAFNPLRSSTTTRMTMAADKPSVSKLIGAAFLASSMISMPVIAKEGAPAKISIFGDEGQSSPFAGGIERSEPFYSPYSPYGDGTNAVYKEATPEEIKFWTTKFNTAVKNTEKIPGFVAKKTWTEVRSALNSYNYEMRESMLRLATSSKDPTKATAAAKTYFADLGDIYEKSERKDTAKITAAYEKSVKDLAAFKAFL